MHNRTANFRPVYEHAGLNDEIRSRLPSGLNGLPVAILLAVSAVDSTPTGRV